MDNPLLEDDEMSSGSSAKRHCGNIGGMTSVTVTLPNSQATVTNLPSAILPMSTSFNSSPDDNTSNSSAISCINRKPCLESQDNNGLANNAETVGNTSMELLTNDVQASPWNGEEAGLPVSSDAAEPTFFQLLEGVSPHVQSVLINKCNVLELSSLAVVSSSLRAGALHTMEKRSLNIRIRRNDYRYADDPLVGKSTHRTPKETHSILMRIDDISDPSRSIVIAFCNCESDEYSCRPWLKIQKLLYFCGHAFVKRIEFDRDPTYDHTLDSQSKIATLFVHSSKSELCLDELFVEELYSETCECFKLLEIVSPRILELTPCDDPLNDGDATMCAKLDAVVQSRGMRSAESISMCLFFLPTHLEENIVAFDDEQMMMLTASSITLYTGNEEFDYPDYDPTYISWSPVGVSRFIEQWLRGSRVIKKLHSLLSLEENESVADFGKCLLEALQRLVLPPKVEYSTNLNDDLRGQLQILDGKMIYEEGVLTFGDDASIIHVTASDDRRLTIVVSKAWDVKHNIPTIAGFIDIFPSI